MEISRKQPKDPSWACVSVFLFFILTSLFLLSPIQSDERVITVWKILITKHVTPHNITDVEDNHKLTAMLTWPRISSGILFAFFSTWSRDPPSCTVKGDTEQYCFPRLVRLDPTHYHGHPYSSAAQPIGFPTQGVEAIGMTTVPGRASRRAQPSVLHLAPDGGPGLAPSSPPFS